MMSDMESVRSDLAFLRDLVDEDARPGLWLFGALYVAFGIVLVAHVALSWGVAQGYVPLHGPSLLATYAVLYGLFCVSMVIIRARARRQSGLKRGWSASTSSVKGRAGASALGGAFLAHFAIMGSFVIASRRLGEPHILELLPVTLFALQGVAWIVVHTMRRQRWHAGLAWAWFAAAVGASLVVGTPWFSAFIAAVAILLMIVPGVHMLRAARHAP